jgi:hypothetical protein
MMKEYLLLQFFIYFLISCTGQEKKGKYSLHIINKSSMPIDSILIHKGIKISQEVGIGQTKSVEIDLSNEDIAGEGAFPSFIYQNGKKYYAQWGFHDWSKLAKTYDSIYLFDNGVNYKNENLVKPKELTLFLIDKMSSGIDSIYTEALITKYVKPTYIELSLDFGKIEKNPVLKIYQGGKFFIVGVDHDWNDWNNTQEFIYVYDEGVFSKKEL